MKRDNKLLHEIASELDDDLPQNTKSDNFWLKRILEGIKNIISDVSGLDEKVDALLEVEMIEIVGELPTASADTKNAFYLVPSEDSSVDNVYDVYVTVQEGSTYRWEQIDGVHIDLSGKLDISQPNYKGKNVVVDSTTGDITFEDKPVIPSDVSDLTDNNNTQFTPKSHTHTESDITDLGDYLEKSNTSGLVRNDGTIDTNQYLTQHQTLPEIVDNLITNDNTKVLSAKQGKALNDKIGDIVTFFNGSGN